MRSEDFPEPLVDPGEIFPGGPPPDRIPPIDDPAFISVEAAGGWLDDAAAVVALEVDGDARADPVQVLIRREIVNDTVGIDLGGRPPVILWKAGRASALDRSGVAAGADVGSVGGFDPTVDGRRLTFTADADGTFSDEQTGTRWDVTGVAISGGPAGDGVDRILHLDTSWFASSTRRPGTTPATPEATVGAGGSLGRLRAAACGRCGPSADSIRGGPPAPRPTGRGLEGVTMLFLDSASLDDARTAAHLGWVAGITTNPKLMAAAGEAADRRLARLLEVFPDGPVFFQPSRTESAAAEAERAIGIAGTRLVVKLPAQEAMFRLGAGLAARGHRVAVTAVYSPAQAVLGAAIGAAWVIPYVDRAERLRPGARLLPSLREALDGLDDPPEILAASIKSPAQAVAALTAGAKAVTAPLEVLRAMACDPLTDAAVDEFAQAAGAPPGS